MIGPTLRRVYSRTPVAHDGTYRARRAEVLIDCAPPRAAADIVVQRIEDTPCLLPPHERDDRPPVGPIPPTPATKRVGVGGKTDPTGGVIAHLGDHRRRGVGCLHAAAGESLRRGVRSRVAGGAQHPAADQRPDPAGGKT